MYVLCMYVLGGVEESGWGLVVLMLPETCPKYAQDRAEQHIVCGHCSYWGLLQISRPGPPACSGAIPSLPEIDEVFILVAVV